MDEPFSGSICILGGFEFLPTVLFMWIWRMAFFHSLVLGSTPETLIWRDANPKDHMLMKTIAIFARGILIPLLIILFVAGCAPVEQSESAATASPETMSPEGSDNIVDSSTQQQQAHQTLTFLFFSDTQPNPDTMDQTAYGNLLRQAMAADDTMELVIFGGDTVDDGGDEEQWFHFWQAAGSALNGVVTAAVPGNHDNHALLSEQFDYPGTAPARPGEGFFYSLRIGPVFFVILDSNIMGAANQRDIDWLREELESEAARTADWRIAVMHHPMWPVINNPNDARRADAMKEHFLPILETYNVQLILCGHQHVYSRTLPMRGDAATGDESGIVQIMAASGDKASYSMGERDYVVVGDQAPNYLLLAANSERLSVTAFSSENTVIDQHLFVIGS